MAAPCVRRPRLGISVLLLLIFIQMLTSLVLFGGVFILSDETLISPFLFCVTLHRGERFCHREADSELKTNALTTVVILGLYVPLVLVAFALLSMLFAAYAKDRGTLQCSLACQAASGLLILTGIAGFLLLNQFYASWEHMTPWFYVCVGAQLELVFTTALTQSLPADLLHPHEEPFSP